MQTRRLGHQLDYGLPLSIIVKNLLLRSLTICASRSTQQTTHCGFERETEQEIRAPLEVPRDRRDTASTDGLISPGKTPYRT